MFAAPAFASSAIPQASDGPLAGTLSSVAAEAPASSPDTVQSNATAISANLNVQVPRTDLGYDVYCKLYLLP